MDPQTRLIAVEILNGIEVDVVAGQIFGDTMRKPLSRKGAEMIIEQLVGTGFEVVRADLTPPPKKPEPTPAPAPKAEEPAPTTQPTPVPPKK